MKRTALDRRTPLERRTRLRAGGRLPARRARQRRGPPRDPAYRAAVRTLPCCAPGAPAGCWGATEASHTGSDKGVGMKSSDYSCVPKCHGHHLQWEGRSGVFAGWTRADRQFWAENAVRATQTAIWKVTRG